MISRFITAVVAATILIAVLIFVALVTKADGAAGLSELVFLVVIGTTVTGAVIATNSVRLIRAVSGLAICFIGVAGLYYYLNSPFVALMEMLIYVGAVCVTIVFAIMLAEPNPEGQIGRGNALVGPASFFVGALLFWGLAALSAKTLWHGVEKVNNGSVLEVGKSLLTTYSMVFELISLVLLVAIIGSLVLARGGRDQAGRNS